MPLRRALPLLIGFALLTSACLGAPPASKSTVTFRTKQHVLVADPACATQCQGARPSVSECMLRCPAAVLRNGPCPARTHGEFCVARSELVSESRRGHCGDQPRLPAHRELIGCRDNESSQAVGEALQLAFLLLPLLLVGAAIRF